MASASAVARTRVRSHTTKQWGARNSFPVKGDNLAIFQSNYAKTACWQKKKQQKTATQALYFVVFRHFTVLRYASSRFNVRGKITGTCKIMQESCVYLRVHLQRINGIFICIHVQLPFCEWDQHDKMNMQESTYSLLLTFFCDVSGCYTVLIWFPCFFTLIRGDFLTHIVAGGTWPEPRFD